MASKLIALDESKQRRHDILSVGGIVLDFTDLSDIEARWRDARQSAGIDDGIHLKYSLSWPQGPEQRAKLIAAIGQLPLQAVIALLEDFRPRGMRLRKETRKDSYVQRLAFEWTLQRFAGDLFVPDAQGPHLVMIDGRDDFREFQDVYARGYADGWPDLPYHPMPPLRDRGFSASLAECSNGPLHEIADLLTSCVTRWADERCAAHKDGKPRDLEELDQCMSELVGLFPVGAQGFRPKRCGHSIIVHTQNLTGKDLLHDNVDRWAHDLAKSAPNAQVDDIPF
jgi:hypothetical protein